ncbi:MAG: hypothetical protein ISN26_01300 [Betaproteobacteria bacterium AqS2]|uniref:Uncharacterized protein n=1 Tax=Candidatus Amphirhobacter heronislandensis TaxID=1732024 RepID=A0A930Y2B7_9GAMM|nr:hypothetical protein [Betaproteobacteria bacterium AqS2]
MIEEIKAFKEGRTSPLPLAKLIPMAGLIQAIVDEVRAYKEGSAPPSADK